MMTVATRYHLSEAMSAIIREEMDGRARDRLALVTEVTILRRRLDLLTETVGRLLDERARRRRSE